MREHLEKVLKIVCAMLAALLAVQMSRFAFHKDVLAGLAIPAVPTLAADTNSTAANPPPANASRGTNSTPSHPAGSTNMASGPARTNGAAASTNVLARSANAASSRTNSIAKATNSPPGQSNPIPPQMAGRRGPGRMRGMPPGMGGGGPMGKQVELPPQIQARVERIYQSELLGPVIHPVPMGLLGIAGDTAFLRAPTGQTGLVKAGAELGGVKVLRIGTNRVLVEHDGKQEELTVFNGLGGESLLPKTKENPQ